MTIKKETLSKELKYQYIIFLMPIIILISIKIYMRLIDEIPISPVWSFAAAIIFSQNAIKWRGAEKKVKKDITLMINKRKVCACTTKCYIFSAVSFSLFALSVAEPTYFVGYSQIFMFLLASLTHFLDGFSTHMLKTYLSC